MELFVGAKLVKAKPEAAPIDIGKYKKGDPGYKVEYEDGYTSWSPKDVFEKAYHPASTDFVFGLTLNDNPDSALLGSFGFDNAIRLLKKGYRLSRYGWNGKEQYIFLGRAISYRDPEGNIENQHHNDYRSRAIIFKGTSGTQVGWLASQADMLAEDWGVYNGR